MISQFSYPIRWSFAYRFFIVSTWLILAITCLAKVSSSFGTIPLLKVDNTVLPVTNKTLLQLGIALEACSLAVLLSNCARTTKLLCILWTSLLFIIYRIGHFILDPGAPCLCLGQITGSLPISPGVLQASLVAICLYMFLGSLMFLFLSRGRHA
jgi:hypothetical protein